ncbi:MAG TPA: anhydro-N-acetylmuramic acid kinase, partial [Candidatus Wallbacteria bacterium]|nr:anhydro-N-acetylmuramic acid kinase [Candidatus Wallbacteria bacterium]
MVKIISKKITEYKTVIGIMTGTSLDGVDTLVTRIKGRGVSTRHENLCFKVFEIPSALKERMRSIMRDKTAALEEICRINFELASLYAGCIKKICRASG